MSRAGPQPVTWALFGLKGRIRRATYALGVALVFSLWWVVMAQMFAAPEGSSRLNLWAAALGIVMFASAYCIYALAHKRLHDLGYRGVYALLLVVLQFISPGYGWMPYVVLALIPGEEGDNAYGPPPVSANAPT